MPVCNDLGINDQPKADPIYPLTPLPRRWRFDLWSWEDETEAEIASSWAALGQSEVENERALRELKALVSGQDWTPRTIFSRGGRPAAATGGLWAMGSPQGLVEKMRAMEVGDYLLVATDGALLKVMENVDGSWRAVPQMGGGWVIGIAKQGTNPELPGVGRVEWVAAGAVQVRVTSWGVKASSYLAESGGMVGAMRALTQASKDFSNDILARRPNIAQFCDSQSLVKSIEGRMQDCKLARNSATRVWWPQISAMLRWWRRGGGAKWDIKWRSGHIERRVRRVQTLGPGGLGQCHCGRGGGWWVEGWGGAWAGTHHLASGGENPWREVDQ